MTPPDLTVVPDVEQELDRLYAAPLTEFTGARNELVKRLRKAGDKTRAEHVAALRKPSVTAWAINQTTRRAPGQVEAVVQAGRELFEAQRATLGGETAGRFETAQTQHRDAVRAVVRTARSILRDSGHADTDQAGERIASTVRAASVDEAGRQLLQTGRFEGDFEGAGMLLLAGHAPSTPRAVSRKRAKTPETHEPAGARRSADVAPARAALREAQGAERDLRRHAERAEREAEEASKRVDEAQAAARRAAERAAAARAEAASAAEAVREAERRLEQLEP